MIYVVASRKAYIAFEISNVRLVATKDNPADGLTMPRFCKPLFDSLNTATDSTPVTQRIVRMKEDLSVSLLEKKQV